MIIPSRRPRLVASALFAAWARLATAQSIDDAVAKTRDGQVRFSFALREGVCGNGSGITTLRRGESTDLRKGSSRSSRDVEYDVECEPGPGRVVLDVERGAVTALRFHVGGRWRQRDDATDLGTVSAARASGYLLKLAQTDGGRPGRDAVFPLTVVDSVTVWPSLIALARDESRPRETRKNAVFWLGQAAEEPATRGLDDLVGEATLDREVRESAIFALSRRPAEEGIPALIRVVKTNKDPAMRKRALFWLGQSGDPRALDLIEELLAKR